MNLRKIVSRGLAVCGLVAALNVFANEIPPKVHADELTSIQFIEQENILSLGYDTDNNGDEDIMFKYRTREPYSGSLLDFYLMDYAKDLNKDGQFASDEWFGNLGYLRILKEEKEDLLEVDPDGLLSLDFSIPKKTILLEYIKQENMFSFLLEIEDGFVINDDTPGGERYSYTLDNYHINKTWPLQHVGNTELESYAIDTNNDWEFSDDEWREY